MDLQSQQKFSRIFCYLGSLSWRVKGEGGGLHHRYRGKGTLLSLIIYQMHELSAMQWSTTRYPKRRLAGEDSPKTRFKYAHKITVYRQISELLYIFFV